MTNFMKWIRNFQSIVTKEDHQNRLIFHFFIHFLTASTNIKMSMIYTKQNFCSFTYVITINFEHDLFMCLFLYYRCSDRGHWIWNLKHRLHGWRRSDFAQLGFGLRNSGKSPCNFMTVCLKSSGCLNKIRIFPNLCRILIFIVVFL